jgi:predicted MPP superfamily phosphohydrolase
MQKHQPYSFSAPDREDELRTKFYGLIWEDKRHIHHVSGPWYLLAYLVVLFGSLSLGFRLFLDSSELYIVPSAILLAWIVYGVCRHVWSSEHWPSFRESLPAAVKLFIVSKWESLIALVSSPIIGAFVLLERCFDRRYLPLWIVTRVASISVLVSSALMIYCDANIFSRCPYLQPLIARSWTDLVHERARDTVWSRLGLVGHYVGSWLGWTYAQAMAFAAIGCFVCWFFSRRIDTNARALPGGVHHLSDLHVTSGADKPIQPNAFSNKKVFKKLRAQARVADVLVITGDITDGGLREEWHDFLAACMPLQAETKFVMCPGNHDLHPYSHKYRPKVSAIPMTSCLPRLRKIRYLRAVSELCPGGNVMGAGGPIALNDYVARYDSVFSEYAYGNDGTLAREIDSIWEAAFPMFWTIADKTFVALDTNRLPSNLLTSALGEVSTAQLRRLKQIAKRLPTDTKLVVLGHHHVYTPPSKNLWVEFKMKYLQLLRSNALTRVLSKIDCHYLHGHRHYTFRFSIGKMSVASAPSSRYDDTV